MKSAYKLVYSSNTESTLDSYAKNKLLAVLTGLLYDAVSENHHTQLEIHSSLPTVINDVIL